MELEHNIEHLSEWAKDRSVETDLLNGPAFSYIRPEPLGVALVIAAWNYPVFTAIAPVACAIAAGNCVILKPSVRDIILIVSGNGAKFFKIIALLI